MASTLFDWIETQLDVANYAKDQHAPFGQHQYSMACGRVAALELVLRELELRIGFPARPVAEEPK